MAKLEVTQIHKVEFTLERKRFEIVAAVNRMGPYLRIVETTAGRSNTIIIPLSGAEQFNAALIECALKAEGATSNPDPVVPTAPAVQTPPAAVPTPPDAAPTPQPEAVTPPPPAPLETAVPAAV